MGLVRPFQEGLDQARRVGESEKVESLVLFLERCVRYVSFVAMGRTIDRYLEEKDKAWVALAICMPTFTRSLEISRRLDERLRGNGQIPGVDWERSGTLPRCEDLSNKMSAEGLKRGRPRNLWEHLKGMADLRNDIAHQRLGANVGARIAAAVGPAVEELVDNLGPLSWTLDRVQSVDVLPGAFKVRWANLNPGEPDRPESMHSRAAALYRGACFVRSPFDTDATGIWPFAHVVEKDGRPGLYLQDKVTADLPFIDAAQGGGWRPEDGESAPASPEDRFPYLRAWPGGSAERFERVMASAERPGRSKDDVSRELLSEGIILSSDEADKLAAEAIEIRDAGPREDAATTPAPPAQAADLGTCDFDNLLKLLQERLKRGGSARVDRFLIDEEERRMSIRIDPRDEMDVWSTWSFQVSAVEYSRTGTLWLGVVPDQKLPVPTPFQLVMADITKDPAVTHLVPAGSAVEAMGIPSRPLFASTETEAIRIVEAALRDWADHLRPVFEKRWDQMQAWQKLASHRPRDGMRSSKLKERMCPEAVRDPCFVLRMGQALWSEGEARLPDDREAFHEDARAWFERFHELCPQLPQGRWGMAKTSSRRHPRVATSLALEVIQETTGEARQDLLEWVGLVAWRSSVSESVGQLERHVAGVLDGMNARGIERMDPKWVVATSTLVDGLIHLGRVDEAGILLERLVLLDAVRASPALVDRLVYVAATRDDLPMLRTLRDANLWCRRARSPTKERLEKLKSRGKVRRSLMDELAVPRPPVQPTERRTRELEQAIDRELVGIL